MYYWPFISYFYYWILLFYYLFLILTSRAIGLRYQVEVTNGSEMLGVVGLESHRVGGNMKVWLPLLVK